MPRQDPRTYDEKTRYRVTKTARELRPRVLPAWWDLHEAKDDGAFYFSPALTVLLTVEVIDGKLWLHVSARGRRPNLPSWDDMAGVKRLFIGRERKAIMVLPPEAEHVNIDPNVLHWFSPLEGDPLPDFRWTDVETGQVGL